MGPRPLLVLTLMVCTACSRTPAPPVDGVLLSRSAGVRYPQQPDLLRAELDRLLEAAGLPPPSPVTALVVPHAGMDFSGKAAAAAFIAVRDRKLTRVVILAPSHAGLPTGAVLPRAHAIRTPLGEVPIDVGAVALLSKAPGFRLDDTPFVAEHSIDAILPFVQRTVGAVPLIPVLVSANNAAEARALAQGLQPLIDARTLVIVSTNLTHAGPRFGNPLFESAPGAPLRQRISQADAILLKPVLSADLGALDPILTGSHAGICGQGALRLLLALLPRGATGDVRDYDNSFSHDDTTPADQVSYAGIVFGGSWPEVAPFPEDDRAALLAAARAALLAAVGSGTPPEPPLSSPRLLERRGLFVTLYAGDEVRASVGQLTSDEPLGRTVVELARAAALHPPGSAPVSPSEVTGLRIELAVLGPLHGLHELAELKPGRQGVYLAAGAATALLLPEPPQSPAPTAEALLQELSLRAKLPRKQVTAEVLRTFDATVLDERPASASAQGDAGPR